MMMSMRGPSTFVTMIGVGAGLMYFMDPQAGRRRRAAVRDQVTHASNVFSDTYRSTSRDLGHRAQGFVARGRRVLGFFQRGREAAVQE